MSIRLVSFILLAIHTPPVLVGWRWGAWAGFLGVLFLHALLLATIFILRCDPFGTTLRKFRTDEKAVCITIDDGPSADTEEILSILREAGARAIFFLVGRCVVESPGHCARIIEQGHLVGNHTLTHPAGWFWCYLPGPQRREIASASRAIHDACGVDARLFRPPAGFRNWFNEPTLRALGMRNVGWSARGFVAMVAVVEGVLRRILDALEPGAIILLHQGQAHHTRLLRRLLEELKSDGWRVTIPPELE